VRHSIRQSDPRRKLVSLVRFGGKSPVGCFESSTLDQFRQALSPPPTDHRTPQLMLLDARKEHPPVAQAREKNPAPLASFLRERGCPEAGRGDKKGRDL
jgi:hypothetical protein